MNPAQTPGARNGWLEYFARIPHETLSGTVFAAYLRGPDGTQVLPVLDQAILVRVNQRGLLLCGQEIVVTTPKGAQPSSVQRFKQAWIVKLPPATVKSLDT